MYYRCSIMISKRQTFVILRAALLLGMVGATLAQETSQEYVPSDPSPIEPTTLSVDHHDNEVTGDTTTAQQTKVDGTSSNLPDRTSPSTHTSADSSTLQRHLRQLSTTRTHPIYSPLPGKRGVGLLLREPGQEGSYEVNMPKVIMLKPYWNYSWGSKRVPTQPDDIEFVPMIWGYFGIPCK
jgi:hypothetical protein